MTEAKPFRYATFCVRSSKTLLHLGRDLSEETEKRAGNDADDISVYDRLVANMSKEN